MARNNSVSNELRVGIMFITGLILGVLVFISLSRWKQGAHTFSFDIQFANVQGLQRGAEVRVSGVKVGFVEDIDLKSEERNRVVLHVRVQKNVEVHANDVYIIGIGSLVGERFVEVDPGPANNRGEVVSAGDVVAGTTLPDFDSVVANANALVDQLKTVTANVNAALGPENQQNLAATLSNLRVTSANASKLTAELTRVLAKSESSVNLILANLSDVSTDLRQVSDSLTPQLRNATFLKNLDTASANLTRITGRVSSLVDTISNVLEDKDLAASLRKTLQNLQTASADLEAIMGQAKTATGSLPTIVQNMATASAELPKITANVQTASAELPKITANMQAASIGLLKITKPFVDIAPETAANIQAIAQRLRKASDQVGDIAMDVTEASKVITETHLIPEARLTGLAGGAPSPRSDLNVDVRLRRNMFRTGVTDIARTSRLNLQFGNQVGANGWVRYGLVESQFGVGADYTFNPNLRGSVELFDPGKPRANALLDLRMKPFGNHWWLTSGWYGIHDRDSFGVGLTFREE